MILLDAVLFNLNIGMISTVFRQILLIFLGVSFYDTWESKQHDIDDDMPHGR